MAAEAALVARRCQETTQTTELDLSQCKLTQIPDAVFILVRSVVVTRCDLSQNVLTRVPPKLGQQFSQLTEFNVSNNRLGDLPEELGVMTSLVTLNMAANGFKRLPQVLLRMGSLRTLQAENNDISDIDASTISWLRKLTFINLADNPLSETTRKQLEQCGEDANIEF
ncbi:hypothetical protein LSAT2_022111 [Lamellibrachia satsuma]|nr:hypothetical protein LSAT2_022111 [Lamellibrachia satsuma]